MMMGSRLIAMVCKFFAKIYSRIILKIIEMVVHAGAIKNMKGIKCSYEVHNNIIRFNGNQLRAIPFINQLSKITFHKS